MTAPAPKVTVQRRGNRVRVTATRGAVTTQATFTNAEATQLHAKLGKALGARRLGGQTGEPT